MFQIKRLVFCTRLMLGLMLPTWFLSMWISNTATTAMMVPIANAILLQLRDTDKNINKGILKANSSIYLWVPMKLCIKTKPCFSITLMINLTNTMYNITTSMHSHILSRQRLVTFFSYFPEKITPFVFLILM